MLDMLASWMGDEFGDRVLEPIGEFIRLLFEGIVKILFGWLA